MQVSALPLPQRHTLLPNDDSVFCTDYHPGLNDGIIKRETALELCSSFCCYSHRQMSALNEPKVGEFVETACCCCC